MRAVVAIKDIADVVRGVSFDKSEASDEPRVGYLPILRAGNIDRELLIDRDLVWVPGERIAKEQRMHPGDIAICMSSGSPLVVGKTAPLRRPWEGSVGAFCAIVRPRAKVMPEYLSFFLQSEPFRAWTRQSSGANIKNIRKSELESFELPLPSMDEQRRIVDLLSRAEGIVRLRREALKKAAEIIPALFLDMFGDPATNPKGWPVARLGNVADVVSGITKGRSLNGKATKSVPYLRVANVQAGYLDLTEMKEIEATPTEIKGLTLLAGDIVLTEGGDYDKLGRGAQWRGEVTPCIHQNHVFRVRLHPDLAEPDYFEAYLQTHAATRYFLSVAKRTTNLVSINMTQLRNLPVMLPSVEFQRAFVEQVSRVRSIQLQSSAASLTAQTTFNALLGRVFSQAPSETQEPVAQTRRQRAAIG